MEEWAAAAYKRSRLLFARVMLHGSLASPSGGGGGGGSATGSGTVSSVSSPVPSHAAAMHSPLVSPAPQLPSLLPPSSLSLDDFCAVVRTECPHVPLADVTHMHGEVQAARADRRLQQSTRARTAGSTSAGAGVKSVSLPSGTFCPWCTRDCWAHSRLMLCCADVLVLMFRVTVSLCRPCHLP
jgi:hypothetical protein